MTTKLNPQTWRIFQRQWELNLFPISNLGESFCSRFDITNPEIAQLYQDKKGWAKLRAYVMNNMPLGENLDDEYESVLESS